MQSVGIEPNKVERRDSLEEAALPSAVLGGVTSLQALLQQMLSPLGRGMHRFVFDDANLPNCGQGGFAIPYNGVRYTYEMPMPGCPNA